MEASLALDERVKEIIASQLGVEKSKVVPGARIMDDLGADSLDIVELVMAMEDAFQIQIPDDRAEFMSTVHDAIVEVKNLTKELESKKLQDG